MIGRGLMAEPLLAKLIKGHQSFTFEDQTYDLKNKSELIDFYLKHFVLNYIEICPRKDTNFLVGRSKQLIKLLGRNHPSINLFFDQIKPCQDFKAIELLIHEYINR